MGLAISIQCHTRNPADKFTQDFKIDVAIYELRPRLGDWPFGEDLRHSGVVSGPHRAQAQIRPKPGIVRKQLFNPDGVFTVRLEFGPVPDHRVVQADAALFNK